jgi:hypothetical protein
MKRVKKVGNGYEWRGRGEQGSKEGNYYNPQKGTSLHPDLDHQGTSDHIGIPRSRRKI